MKCKFCGYENMNPPKAGKDRNGIQRYYCQGCHRQIQDQNDYNEWALSRRKRAPNNPSNINKFDEYVTYAIFKILENNYPKKVNGIGSSYSIAALLERAPSTVQLWLKKYKNTNSEPQLKIKKPQQLREYANSKKFGIAIIEFFSMTNSLFKSKKSKNGGQQKRRL